MCLRVCSRSVSKDNILSSKKDFWQEVCHNPCPHISTNSLDGWWCVWRLEGKKKRNLPPVVREKELSKLCFLFLQGMNLETYVPSAEWDIVKNTATQNVVIFDCCPGEEYSYLTFELKLQRRINFHIKLVILPTLLLSVVSLFIFWIPVHRPDRTSLSK